MEGELKGKEGHTWLNVDKSIHSVGTACCVAYKCRVEHISHVVFYSQTAGLYDWLVDHCSNKINLIVIPAPVFAPVVYCM